MAAVQPHEVSIPAPAFGLGTTWYAAFKHNLEGDLDENTIQITVAALKYGNFVHLDLAEMYGNDREVAEGLSRWKAEGGNVDSLFITSKVFDKAGDIYQAAVDSLKRLGIPKFNLYLLHSPPEFWQKKGVAKTGLEEAWRAMERLVKDGLAVHIGVSNFRASDIRALCALDLVTRPLVNQVEFHPYLQQPLLQKVCEDHGIRMEAYCPLGPITHFKGGPVEPVLEELAAKHKVSTAAVLLRYTQQKGYLPITTTSKVDRMFDAINAVEYGDRKASVTLTEADIKAIDEAGAKWSRRNFWPEEIPQNTDAGLL